MGPIRRHGGEALAVQTDVREGRQVEALTQQAVTVYGRLDILVNNVGVFGGRQIAETAVFLATLGPYSVVHQIVVDRLGAEWS